MNVGAASEAELKEKKARVEDALHATRAAVAEGIVPGGGVSFIRALRAIEKNKSWKGVFGKKEEVSPDEIGHVTFDYAAGMEIVRRAMMVPLQTIADNAGEKGTVIVSRVAEGDEKIGDSYGFNALTLEYGDMLKMGVLTPAKVDRSALQNASSVATILLTADCLITEKPQDKNAAAGAPDMGGMGGGMGGMGGGMPGMGGMGGMGGMPGMGGMGF